MGRQLQNLNFLMSCCDWLDKGWCERELSPGHPQLSVLPHENFKLTLERCGNWAPRALEAALTQVTLLNTITVVKDLGEDRLGGSVYHYFPFNDRYALQEADKIHKRAKGRPGSGQQADPLPGNGILCYIRKVAGPPPFQVRVLHKTHGVPLAKLCNFLRAGLPGAKIKP